MPIIGQISVGDGATFTPAVDSDGVISWTNNKNLTNPASVDIPQAVIDRYQLAPTSNPTFTGTVTAEDITASGTITGNVTGTASGNLPLSGGTMTGDIVLSGAAIKASTDDSNVVLMGASSWENGSMIQAFGKNHADYPGWFSLRASDGVNSKILIGRPDGTFTWAGKTIPTKDVNIQTGKTASTSVPANSTVSIPITFSPAFSSVPVVIATVQTSYDHFYASVGSVSTSGASIKVNNASGTERSVTTGWMAISI